MLGDKEQWQPIASFEDIYAVSSLGRIKRIKGAKGTKPGYILIGSPHPKGYRCVLLRKQNKFHSFLIHRLVAATFIRPILAGEDIHHVNGVKDDNRVENLCILSAEEHQSLSVENRHEKRGEERENAKLLNSEVLHIRRTLRHRYSNAAIAAMYGVSTRTIYSVLKGEHYGHLPLHCCTW